MPSVPRSELAPVFGALLVMDMVPSISIFSLVFFSRDSLVMFIIVVLTAGATPWSQKGLSAHVLVLIAATLIRRCSRLKPARFLLCWRQGCKPSDPLQQMSEPENKDNYPCTLCAQIWPQYSLWHEQGCTHKQSFPCNAYHNLTFPAMATIEDNDCFCSSSQRWPRNLYTLSELYQEYLQTIFLTSSRQFHVTLASVNSHCA